MKRTSRISMEVAPSTKRRFHEIMKAESKRQETTLKILIDKYEESRPKEEKLGPDKSKTNTYKPALLEEHS